MRIVVLALTFFLIITLAACNKTATNSPPPAIQSLQAQLAQAQLEQQQLIERIGREGREKRKHEALDPLQKWLAEEPTTCKSPNLAFASENVLRMAADLDERVNITIHQEVGGYILDIADAAKVHGCKSVARQLYDKVIAIYVGTTYSGLRERAHIGIDDLRAS